MLKLFRKQKQPLSRRDELAKRRAEQPQESDIGVYQRNQTISHNRLSHEEVSVRQEVRQSLRKRRLVVSWATGVFSSLVIIGMMMWQLTVNTSTKSSVDLSSASQQAYLDLLNDYFTARPIERLRFLANYQALNQFFHEKSPEIASVELVDSGKPFKSTLNIVFRQPVAQWISEDGAYYVDAQGVIFETNFFSTPGISISDRSGIPAYQGQSGANKRFLSFLGQVVTKFTEADFTVTEAILPPDTARQIEIRLKDRQTIIRMTVDRATSAQVGEAIHAIRHFDSLGKTPEYIDVRVDQRVFYK